MKRAVKTYNANNPLLNSLFITSKKGSPKNKQSLISGENKQSLISGENKQSLISSENKVLYFLVSLFSFLMILVFFLSLVIPVIKDYFLITT